MASKGGRKYARDSRGRFSSTGGGGKAASGGGKASSGGSKAATTRKANTARAEGLRAKGTTGLGGRVKAKGFQGGKSAQMNAGGLRSVGGNRSKAAAPGSFKARSAQVKVDQKARQRSASKAGKKTEGKFDKKAPVSPAKAQYKALKSAAGSAERRNLYSSPGRSDAKAISSAAGATKRKLGSFVKNRGVTKSKKR